MGVTLREACRRLGFNNPHYMKGFVDGRGVRLQPVGKALCMSESDFRKVERAFRRLRSTAA